MLGMSSRRRRRLDISRSARRVGPGRGALPASLRPQQGVLDWRSGGWRVEAERRRTSVSFAEGD